MMDVSVYFVLFTFCPMFDVVVCFLRIFLFVVYCEVIVFDLWEDAFVHVFFLYERNC